MRESLQQIECHMTCLIWERPHMVSIICCSNMISVQNIRVIIEWLEIEPHVELIELVERGTGSKGYDPSNVCWYKLRSHYAFKI